jgi:hypothetical protein
VIDAFPFDKSENTMKLTNVIRGYSKVMYKIDKCFSSKTKYKGSFKLDFLPGVELTVECSYWVPVQMETLQIRLVVCKVGICIYQWAILVSNMKRKRRLIS